MTRLVIILLFVCIGNSVFADQRYQFETEQQRQLYLQLVAELRCPKCQNQNIADSNAMISEDMKRKVHELILEGYTKDDVIDFMKQRYGEFVHYKPPVTPLTVWLYLLPLLFVVIMVFAVVRGKQSRQDAPLDKEALAKAEQALKDIE